MADEIFARLQEELQFLLHEGATDNSADLWSSRANAALLKFVTPDREIDREAIGNFRRNQIFINEMPSYGNSLRDWVAGARRAEKIFLGERYRVMQEAGDAGLLSEFPVSETGNPYLFEHGGVRFNKRWSNNLRYLSLVRRHLAEEAGKKDFAVMDIGGGYGIFLQLMKMAYPGVRPVLVEFPEQLLLAYYYLQSEFPHARINRIRDAYEAGTIDAKFIGRFDFTLVPIDCYEKIAPGGAGLVANFFSLGEMSEEWFDTYRDSEVIAAAPCLLTINRFFSKPTYGTDIDILRYRLHEYEPLHFGVSEYEKFYMTGRAKFFTRRVPYTSQFFEFVGRRRNSARA